MSHPAPLSPIWFKILRGDLSQTVVAKKVGVTRQTWHTWETGRSSPRGQQLHALMRLAEAYGKATGASLPTIPPVTPSLLPKGHDGEGRAPDGAAGFDNKKTFEYIVHLRDTGNVAALEMLRLIAADALDVLRRNSSR